MSHISRLGMLVCFSLFIASYSHTSEEPSSGAQGMLGAKGTFEFKPSDWKSGKASWWKDSDGVDPGLAGCHIGTNEKGIANGRLFGEAYLANGLLVESNPGRDKLHLHGNDTGHPDTFDCNVWCVGNGKKKAAYAWRPLLRPVSGQPYALVIETQNKPSSGINYD